MILGRAGSGKTTFCLEEIKGKLLEDPAGSPIIYLVPEQMTFQSEYKLIRSKAVKGMIRAQVYSFTRLAWRVLQETGGLARYHLKQTGIHMLLRKIVAHEQERLHIFAKSAKTSGFIQQLEELLTEFKRYTITPELLEAQRETLLAKEELAPHEVALADKLHDLYLIFKRLEAELRGRYVDSEDYLRLLAENVPRAAGLQQAEIYVDGFHSFTPQERLVLKALMGTARRVTVALTLDKVRTEVPDELDLFHMTGTTCCQLLDAARETDCEVETPVVLPAGSRFVNPALAHVEAHYDSRPAVPFTGRERVEVLAAVNRRAEVEGIAREILRLVRDEHYRWRDFAVLIRNQEDYYPLIETIFEDYGIPVFQDHKRSMLNHPLIELIRSSLDIIHGNWRYEAVFRCLKTELLFPVNTDRLAMREAVDRLENVALAYGIQGERWYRDEQWRYRLKAMLGEQGGPQKEEERQLEEELNRLRFMLVEPLRKLEQEMAQAVTIRQRCGALYRFLAELDVPRKIEILRDEAVEHGELDKAREHDQVWDAVVDLLDQMVEVTGEEPLSFDLFRQMMETGLESMRFAIVPPAMDQVLVANMEHSRFSDVKCTFILGVNDGIIPAKPQEKGIISEEEREWLTGRGIELASGSRKQLLDEQFLIYLALASPSERLYLSYPLADEEGQSLLPSVLIKRMRDLFPDLEETLILNEPNEEGEQKQLTYVNHPSKTLSYLASELQAWKRGYPVHPLWWDVYNWYMADPEWHKQARRVLDSLFYRNEARQLSKEVSRSLYGSRLLLSVSRMEKFQSCPFSQFAAYGLKLGQRQIYRLDAPDIGQLFHAALKMMADELREKGVNWASLDREQCEELAKEAVERLAPVIQREILFSSNRYQYMKGKLQKVVGRASFILSEHARRSGFSPVGLEVGFGPQETLPPLRFTLKNGITLEVIGRIDRVDKADSSKGTLLRIIDYKSSHKTLNLAEVFFGLALQMLAYLDVVLTHAQTWLGTEALPAGVLYFHVHNPLVQAQGRLLRDEIEQELFKKFKMKGLLLADTEVVQLMDTTLTRGYSEIIPVALKKDGSFYSNSSVISREDFEHVRAFIRRKITEIGERLTEGEIGIHPYKLKQNTPCTWCEYRPLCQFDPSLEANQYRILVPEKGDDILNKIRSEGGESNEGES
ncbi:ATP-dependent helicase/deoxyribonuclease subunit B [Caldalkalibacillus thermarum]|uniref:helicase-exonuclease AddAB subunit AddB n=1 Tax=Caldalkalibacillus thermarum TaxID=296745 RepID=UPI0019BA2EC8|nr:helicase-exonuclease AddAB subunit AddB [Caldalkalibacillus thermarum]GGK28287.1 ATP-dependent helicase/deoxyribonuclease subunit B [Caldalkalibacillus thermarum]